MCHRITKYHICNNHIQILGIMKLLQLYSIGQTLKQFQLFIWIVTLNNTIALAYLTLPHCGGTSVCDGYWNHIISANEYPVPMSQALGPNGIIKLYKQNTAEYIKSWTACQWQHFWCVWFFALWMTLSSLMFQSIDSGRLKSSTTCIPR